MHPIHGLLILSAFAVAVLWLAMLAHDSAAPLLTGLVAVFAAAGVFALLARAAGLLHFALKAPGDDLAHDYADGMAHKILITAPGGSAVFANAAYRRLVGAADGPAPGIEQAFASHSGGAEPVFRLMRAARQGQAWEETVQFAPAGGPPQWLKISVRLLPGRHRKAAQHLRLWEIADITDDRGREAQALARARLAESYLEHAPAGLLTANAEGRLAYVNGALAAWLDVRGGAMENLRLADIISGSGAALLAQSKDAGSEAVQSAGLDLIRQDGATVPVRLFFRWLAVEEAGAPTLHAIALNRLIPAHEHGDDAPADLRFADFFDAAPVAIAMAGEDGAVKNGNAAFLQLSGWGNGQGKKNSSLFDLVEEASRERLAQMVKKAAARKAGIPPVDVLFPGNGKTGRLYLTPMPGADGHGAVIVYGIDTSEKRALEEQVAQGQKMQAVGQLAGGIAHDFNNVLTAVIGFSDLLLARHRPADPAFNDIMNIKQNANRAAGLVRQLLAFSRRQTLRPRVLSLTDVLEDLTILLGRLLGEKITARVIHGRDLWLIKADVNQFEQVIINLAVNGRDAMPGGGELTIRTANISERESLSLGHAGIEPGEYVLCEVSDNGGGIPAEIMEKIFEPFFTTKEVGKGTGLGLSTVYGIIKQTGGYIFPESAPGKGAIFRIYLPRNSEAEQSIEAAAPKTEKKEKPRDLTGSGTVLLVEDEEAVRAFASRALATRGYRVLEAASGAAALDIMQAESGRVDLVVSDVVMPEMDGPTLLKRLREQNPELKIIFMSGYAEEAFKNNLDEDEQFIFLPKPFSLKKLSSAVKEALDGAA